MITYFSWWYYDEPAYLWRCLTIVVKKVYASFSVGILLRTLFDPWKRDVYGAENPSLDMRFKIFLDNLISRFVGFTVRVFTIIIGLILTFMVLILLLGLFAVWLLMPVLIVGLLINGIRLVLNG